MAKLGRKTRYNQRLGALRNERSGWLDHWQQLGDYLCPRIARFQASDQNKGSKINQKILNGKPLVAVREFSAGLMSGCSNQSSTWFRLTTPDPDLAQLNAVMLWLRWSEDRTRKALSASNFYLSLAKVYEDLAVYGTAVLWLDEDEKELLAAETLPVGTYCLAAGANGLVDTVYREFRMTAAQLVERFGREACSREVQDAYDREDFDQWRDVVHLVEPRALREDDGNLPAAEHMPWASVWYEAASEGEDLLKESGYPEKPFMAPRWHLTTGDVYGRSPGMDALGDAKQLQTLESRSLSVLEKHVNPPMIGPSSIKSERISLLAGDITYSDAAQGSQQLQPLIQVDPMAIRHCEEKIRQVEERIDAAMMTHLFLNISNLERSNVTATEIEARASEIAQQVGPALDRLHYELFSPAIERAFSIQLRAGLLPPPPREIQGQEIRIEFVSALAAKQKFSSAIAIDQYAAYVVRQAQLMPEAVDLVDVDKTGRQYAEALGLSPDLLRSEEELEQIRKARADAQAQAKAQAALATAQQAADAARAFSQADMSGDNALSRMAQATPAPVTGAMPP